MDNCPFCQIILDKSRLVYEDDLFAAFLDDNPVFFGHTLLVTKRHAKTIWDLNQEEKEKLANAMDIVSRGVKEALKCDGILIVQNNIVSQSVPHIHFHIIPRQFHDGLHIFLGPRKRYTDEEKEKYRKMIAEAIDKIIKEGI